MKLISKLLLIVYLCTVLSSMAYASNSISVGLSLNPGATYLYNQKDCQLKQLSVEKSFNAALTDFVQDLPQMQDYDWNRARENNKKLFKFLSEI